MKREAWRETLRGLSPEEFQVLREAVREESRAREAQHLSVLRIGDWVEFDDRYGKKHRGTVTRINARTISVYCDPREADGPSTHWRVSASLVHRILPAESPVTSLPEGRFEAEILSSQAPRENPG